MYGRVDLCIDNEIQTKTGTLIVLKRLRIYVYKYCGGGGDIQFPPPASSFACQICKDIQVRLLTGNSKEPAG